MMMIFLYFSTSRSLKYIYIPFFMQDVQNSVANLLSTSEQVRHSSPESTERLRSQTRAIDTLCEDFMSRLGERRNTLQRAHDFYRNAELVCFQDWLFCSIK